MFAVLVVPTVFPAPLTLTLNRTLSSRSTHICKPVSVSSSGWRLLSIRPFTNSRSSGPVPGEDELGLPQDTTTTPQKTKRLFQKIRTLDPSKLVEDDYVDLSLKSDPVLGIILQRRPESTDPLIPPRLSPRNPTFESGVSWSSKRYPPDTRGFMYYRVPPNSSPLAGELRFRLTPSRDPASFATGSDLLTERSGMPWRYPLYKFVCRPQSRDIISLLMQDGLLSQRTLDLVTAAASRRPGQETVDSGVAPSMLDARQPTRLSTAPVLSAFGQEFDFRYAADYNFCAVFAGRDAILTHRMRHVATLRLWLEGKRVRYCPFRGSAICSFERSTLPEHAGGRVVVMRVKRMVESDPIRDVPAPDGRSYPELEALKPREGELLKITTHGQVRPWAADVDKLWGGSSAKHTGVSPWKALRVLFENEKLYGSPTGS